MLGRHQVRTPWEDSGRAARRTRRASQSPCRGAPCRRGAAASV